MNPIIDCRSVLITPSHSKSSAVTFTSKGVPTSRKVQRNHLNLGSWGWFCESSSLRSERKGKMVADVGSSWEKEARVREILQLSLMNFIQISEICPGFASVALCTLSDSFQCSHPIPIALRSERQTLPARLVSYHQHLVVMSPVGGFRWIYVISSFSIHK
jgi:hypothetical protein